MRLLKVEIGDVRLSYATKSNNKLNFIIGHRYCLAFILRRKNPWYFINFKEFLMCRLKYRTVCQLFSFYCVIMINKV
jgi:hypothetical protein